MTFSIQLAKHLRDVYFGGNWTAVNLKDTLQDVDWQMASRQIADCNSIATLVYHMTYYVREVTKVLQGGPLEAKDTFSFDHPPINSQTDWENMLATIWEEAEVFASLIEKLPDERLMEYFPDPKYGIYNRNLLGIIEHLHYHLGQVVLIKKLLAASSS
ncbi:MAG: DinB family protein [Bacteroidota bacterium]